MVIDLDYYIYDQNSNGLHKYNKTDIHNGKSYDYNLQIYQSQFYIYYLNYFAKDIISFTVVKKWTLRYL